MMMNGSYKKKQRSNRTSGKGWTPFYSTAAMWCGKTNDLMAEESATRSVEGDRGDLDSGTT